MADQTNIEWCDSTFNPWLGCTKVSPACDHCYAEVSTPARVKRAAGVETWGPHGQRQRTSAHNWKQPLAWEREHEAFFAEHGRRRRVFCASLADVFDNAVPFQWRRDLFELIAATPNLDWLLLTKRIGNARAMLNAVVEVLSHGINTWDELPWPGVWIGATVCNQEEADRDIPKLLAVPARVRFLSIEPMLGPIDLEKACDIAEVNYCAGTWDTMSDPQRCLMAFRHGSVRLLDWVICGGESGPKARPMHRDWARSLRDQCAEAGVPFLFKQWGEWLPERQRATQPMKVPLYERRWCTLGDGDDRYTSTAAAVNKVGKKAAGRLLDGVEHNGFPELAHG